MTELGSVQLEGNYVTGVANFTGSTMTASGNKVTIVLGSLSGTVHDQKRPATMIWTTPKGTATESGPKDVDF